jgi:hypothetical protein
MWLAWCLFAVTGGLYLVTAALTSADSGRGATEVLTAAAGSMFAFFAIYRWREVSLHETLLTASLVAGFILVLTRGRPARLFDPKAPRLPDSDMSDEEHNSFQRRRRVARLHQCVFLIVVVVSLCWYEFTGATFLES